MLVAILLGRTGVLLGHEHYTSFLSDLTRPTALLAPASIGCLRGDFRSDRKATGHHGTGRRELCDYPERVLTWPWPSACDDGCPSWGTRPASISNRLRSAG